MGRPLENAQWVIFQNGLMAHFLTLYESFESSQWEIFHNESMSYFLTLGGSFKTPDEQYFKMARWPISLQ